MTESCSYHAKAAALWQCQPCAKHYCGECVPGAVDNYVKSTPTCTLCQKPIAYIGASNSARPFWQMGGFYFRYAFAGGPLTLVALAAGVSLLLTGMGILTLALLVATIAVVTRYNLLVIEKLAGGTLAAPAFGEALDGQSGAVFAKVIGMTLVAGAAGVLFARMGQGALQLYSIALSLLAPAAMIVLALENSLRAAVNPLKLLQFTLIIGWPYWLLWLATSAVSAAPGYLIVAVADKVPAQVLLPLIGASTTYFYIVTSAMMGYICLTRQQRLGITPQREDDGEFLSDGEFERARALAETRILMREGRYPDARRVLVEALRRHSGDIALNEHYYRLLLASDDKKALRELSPHLLGKFVQLNQPHKAAELYLATKPLPVIDKSPLRHALAEALYRQRKFQPAAALLNNLHRDDADYGKLDAAYLLLAQIYMDGLHKDEIAKKLLAFVSQKFPDSPLRNQVRTLQGILAGERAV